MAALHAISDWEIPYLAYMSRGELPEDETLARQITRRSKSMTIVNGELHHRSVTGAFQHCVSPEEGCEILCEIHEGDCGHHVSSKSLVTKAVRHGFYWLTAHADAEDLVREGVRNSQILLGRQLDERVMQNIKKNIRRHRFTLKTQPT